MAYVAMSMFFLAFILTAKYPSLQVIFSEYCMAILGATTVYVSGNSIVKFMGKKETDPEEPSKKK